MSPLRLLAAVLALTGGLAFAGCTARPAPVQPVGRVAVPLADEEKRTLVRAKLGNEIVLELPPVPDPAYAWQLFSQDARFLKQLGEIHPAAGPARINLWAIHQVPRTLVRILLVKAGDKEARPIDGHDIIVTIE